MDGFSRDSISDSILKTIQDIKEVAGKYSDEDIYTVLKDCNMDPEETTQKLQYLDTFQEVKKKRDWKKVSVNNNRSFGEYRRKPQQWRGARGDDRYSSHNSDGGRQLNARQENGDRKSIGRGRASISSVSQKESNKIPTVASSVSPSRGSSNGSGKIKDSKKEELPSLRMKQHSDLDHPGPTPTPTPTNPSTARARIPAGSSKGKKSSHLGKSNNGSLSVSDPVLVPSLNPRNSAGAVGIIKRGPETISNLKVDGPSKGVENSCSEPKLQTLCVRQSVIFPNNLCVPEALKNGLTFGSLGPTLDLEHNNNEKAEPRDAPVPTNIEKNIEESSPIPESSSSSPILGQSPSNLPVNSASSQENISSLTYEQSKVGLTQDSLVTPTSDYSSSLVKPQDESTLVTTCKSQSLPTQSKGEATQSGVAISPQLLSYYRQPYPAANYLPYSPYYSQLYMPPQNVPQYSGFPHQPSPGNMYMPPTAASSVPKLPIQPVYKPGHFGYGSYGSSGPGYGSVSAALTTSSGLDELKVNNVHSNLKQVDLGSGRDTSALQGNVYYNLPQGQAMAFPPAQVGHHPTQAVSSQVQSLHQSQPHELLSLSQQQYGDWNKKILN